MEDSKSVETIRKKLAIRRKELGLSYQTLAEKTGISRSTLQRYETGSIKSLPFDKLEVLASGLSLDPAYLMDLKPDGHSVSDSSIYYAADSLVKIPVIGVIRAGQPILAQENIEGYEIADRKDLCSSEEYFYLRVCGDSMRDAGIFPNDRVLIKKQSDVESGDIAAVMIDGEDATLKRVIKKNNTVILKPENTDYELRVFTGREINRLSIIGKAVMVVHRF